MRTLLGTELVLLYFYVAGGLEVLDGCSLVLVLVAQQERVDQGFVAGHGLQVLLCFLFLG